MHRTTAQKIRTNFKTRQAYLLQHRNSKAPVELEPKFGQTIHQTKPTHYNTATPRLKWSWSQNLVKLYTRKCLHTTTQLLQGSSGAGAKIWSLYTQDKAYALQHSHSKAQVELEPKFGQTIHQTKPTHSTTQLLQGSSGAGTKIWSYCTQDKAYTLQHSYSKAPVKLEPKFGHFIHKTKPTHYNTATPRLQ